MTYKKHILFPFIILLMLLLTKGLYAQKIEAPTLRKAKPFELKYCFYTGYDTLDLEFNYNGPFESGNVFIVQLSDADGDFTKPIELDRITNAKLSGGRWVPITAKFPKGTYGENCRIRVVSTKPKVEGEPTAPRPIYYRDLSNPLILNNYNPVSLCSEVTSYKISLNLTGSKYKFTWHRDGSVILGETSSSLVVSKPGVYWADLDAGSCNQNYGDKMGASNKIKVTMLSDSTVEIAGVKDIALCPSERYELKATIDNENYTYKWYKDGKLIDGLKPYQPKITLPADKTKYGKYYVEIGGKCSVKSKEVVVREKQGAENKPVIKGGASQVLLPNEIITLSLEKPLENAEYKWFKNGVELKKEIGASLEVNEVGVYYVEIRDYVGCTEKLKSEEVTVLKLKSLKVDLLLSEDYQVCKSTETTLSADVLAIATNGKEYKLGNEQFDKFNFKWFKDGKELPERTVEYLVKSFEDNGDYAVELSLGTISGKSDPIKIALIKGGFKLLSSTKSLCPGGEMELSFVLEEGNLDDFKYQWFKDGQKIADQKPKIKVTEVGLYSVRYEAFSCENTLEMKVELFDSVIKLSPSSKIVLEEGGSVTVKASGADDFKWYDVSNNKLLGSDSSIELDKTGRYKLVFSSGECEIEKIFVVEGEDGKVLIPNILSPFNGDGVNGTWILPNKYSYSPKVRVIIYNSSGKEIFNTTDYQNDWPKDNLTKQMLYYYRIIKEGTTVKAGTISIIE